MKKRTQVVHTCTEGCTSSFLCEARCTPTALLHLFASSMHPMLHVVHLLFDIEDVQPNAPKGFAKRTQVQRSMAFPFLHLLHQRCVQPAYASRNPSVVRIADAKGTRCCFAPSEEDVKRGMQYTGGHTASLVPSFVRRALYRRCTVT